MGNINQINLEDLQSFNKRRTLQNQGLICHAPFKSMYLNVFGQVNVCCFNRKYSLGNYPEQSLKDIWFSDRAAMLRDAIKKGDLSLGCYGCYNLIKKRSFAGLPAKNFDDLPWHEKGYPTKIDFELSNKCNLECVMCHGDLSSSIRQNREGRSPMHSPYDAEFLKQLEEFIPHCRNAHFLGGEPFLIPVYFEIWEMIARLNPSMEVSVQTNATIMNSRVRDILDTFKVNLSISCDSINKATYEQIRVNGSFDKVMQNIRYFRQYCHESGSAMTLSYCPMKQNWQELPEVIAFCNDLDIDVFFNTVTDPAEHSMRTYSVAELEEVLTYLKKNRPSAASTQRERFNAAAYDDVVALIEGWLDAARRNVAFEAIDLDSIETIDAYYDLLQEFISLNVPADEQEAMFEVIKQRLDFVHHAVEADGTENAALKFLLSIDFYTVINNFPAQSGEELLEITNAALELAD